MNFVAKLYHVYNSKGQSFVELLKVGKGQNNKILSEQFNNVQPENEGKETILDITQCGNYMVFLSVRFYVKSISGFLDVQNLPFEQIQRL